MSGISRAMAGLAFALAAPALAAEADPPGRDRFPLTQGRFGTLGAPAAKAHWDLIGASWFKSGDCYWQAPWVPDSEVHAWLLVRPRMYFTGNNREWNPPPKSRSRGGMPVDVLVLISSSPPCYSAPTLCLP